MHIPRLLGLSHYHQRPGVHPHGRIIPEDHMVIELVTGGNGSVEVAGHQVAVGEGSLLWHYPGDGTINRSKFDDPYRCLSVLFELPEAGERLPRVSNWSDPTAVRSFTRESIRRYHDQAFDRPSLALWLLGELNYRVKQWQRLGAGELPAGLERALTFIRGQDAPNATIEELAEIAGWSPSHLHAMFKQHLQESPHSYQLNRRLLFARELLATTTERIAVIGQRCFFNDATHFSRCFKQHHQVSPAEWRQKHLQPYFPG